jgi:hypothetical protein
MFLRRKECNMKQFILGFLTVIILAVALFFLIRGCEDDPTPPDNSREAELLQTIQQKDDHIAELSKKVDSLQALKSQVVTSIIYRDREIDENIAKDSSNAIVEYRRSLQDNQELPDGTEGLTYREIGIGSKLMAKVPKMQLQINICEEQLFIKESIIADKDFIINSKDDLIELKDKNIEYYKDLYEDESAWYNENWIWLTLGVVVTGGVAIAIGATQ